MDDNIMRRYADKSTEATHFVQYDQGENFYLIILLFLILIIEGRKMLSCFLISYTGQ